MQAQSTTTSQKLSKYVQILSVLSIFAFSGTFATVITTHAQYPAMTMESSSLQDSKLISSVNSSNNAMTTQSVSQGISSGVSNQIIPVSTLTFTGELDRKEGNTIFVSKDNVVNQYSVTSDIKVRRDSMESNITMLKVGDTLTINQSKDGQKIFSIDSISKQSTDIIKWAIVGIVLLLVLIPLIIYLFGKSKKGHIRTSTSTRD